MKVIVTGSRRWDDEASLAESLIEWIAPYSSGQITIVHGACPTGADSIVSRLAKAWGIAEKPYPANWEKYGRAAGPLRNRWMLEDNLDADVVLAFPLGRSVGTRQTMSLAAQLGLKVVDCGDPS